MYAGFRLEYCYNSELKNNSEFYINMAKKEYSEKREKLLNKLKRSISESFNDNDDLILMRDIEKKWFPAYKCHIFLSHSRKDENRALAISGWLKEKCGVDVFIDSCLWKFVDDLLKEMDEMFCKIRSSHYDYKRRNITTSQVHLLLNMALAKMIDNTECFIFLDTPNSAAMIESISSTNTESPWIFSEVLLANLMRRKPKEYHRLQKINESFQHRDSLELPHFIYELDFSNLHRLSIRQIDEASRNCSDAYNVNDLPSLKSELFLDELYSICGVDK